MIAARIDVVPADTWFFGDGRPFHGADEGLASGWGRFPPLPRTMVGALRSALATSLGWNGSEWTPALADVLGDQDRLPAGIGFAGPFLLREVEAGEQLWLPMPQSLLRIGTRHKSLAYRRLRPGGSAISSDMGDMELSLATDLDDYEEMEGWWIEARHLVALIGTDQDPPYLDGSLVRPTEAVAPAEARTGLALDGEGKAARAGRLYQTQHRRLVETPESRFKLAMRVTMDERTTPAAFQEALEGLTELPHAIGGEGRAGWYSRYTGTRDRLADDLTRLRTATSVAASNDTSRPGYAVYLLTPALLDWPLAPGTAIPDRNGDLPGRLVSACCRRAIGVGGWTSDHENGRTSGSVRKNQPAVPAGSVLFMALDDGEQAVTVDCEAVGALTEWGFGQIAVGTW